MPEGVVYTEIIPQLRGEPMVQGEFFSIHHDDEYPG